MELQAEIKPLTLDSWPDLERLFGAKGACGGCWCMWWLLPTKEFRAGQGEANRCALHNLAGSDPALGLLAYVGGAPTAWCALGPRERYPRLGRSRILAPVDDQPVWSVVCFYTARRFRRRGLMVELLRAACQYAGSRGAGIIEGYPRDAAEGKQHPDPFVYTGISSAFVKAGFCEVARRSPTRPIMRYTIATD
ncbi:MAG: GNAT family N-acetyltransferase [Anaerolineae bacterium]